MTVKAQCCSLAASWWLLGNVVLSPCQHLVCIELGDVCLQSVNSEHTAINRVLILPLSQRAYEQGSTCVLCLAMKATLSR